MNRMMMIVGIVHAQLSGRIDVFAIDVTNAEQQIGAIDVHIAADMKMRVNKQRVHGKLMLEHIQMVIIDCRIHIHCSFAENAVASNTRTERVGRHEYIH